MAVEMNGGLSCLCATRQFESYRTLGYFIADTALRNKFVREIPDAAQTPNA